MLISMNEQANFELVLKENIVKNLVIVIIAFLFFGDIKVQLQFIDAAKMGDFLFIVSILLVTVSFANFAFSYEHAGLRSLTVRLLSHFTTFIFLLLTALLLEAFVISVNIVYPSLSTLIFVFSFLLYVSIALYDFWDLLRAYK
jgi:hypothetical protein